MVGSNNINTSLLVLITLFSKHSYWKAWFVHPTVILVGVNCMCNRRCPEAARLTICVKRPLRPPLNTHSPFFKTIWVKCTKGHNDSNLDRAGFEPLYLLSCCLPDSAPSQCATFNWCRVFCRDPWVSVRGRMSGSDATCTAEGSDGEPADGAGRSGGAGQGAQPQPRRDLHPSGHQPRWTAAAPWGDVSVSVWTVRTLAGSPTESARPSWPTPHALWQILTHSRVRDGIWLTPENLKEIYTGLKADKDGNGKSICILQVKIGWKPFFLKGYKQ